MSGKSEQKTPSDAERIADLEGEVKALRAAQSATAGGINLLADRLLKLKIITGAQAKDEEFDVFRTAADSLSALNTEGKGLKRSLAAQKGATSRAKNALEQLEEVAKPRALGPVEGQLKAVELAELLAETERVEIAFSDGSKELIGVPPVAVPGGAFAFRRGKLCLNVPELLLRGPMDERGARSLAGYALLVEGEQIAWMPRIAGAMILGPGKTYQQKDDVVLV